MKLIEDACLLKQMIKLIEVQKTGSPSQLSAKLGISRSQLYVQIDELKSLGAEIKYDRKRNTFRYTGDKRIIVREPILVLPEEELIAKNGGMCQQNASVLFSGRSNINLVVGNYQ